MKTWADFGISWKSSQRGPEIYTLCPQCSDKRKAANRRKPCLSVNLEKEVWYCHHCFWAGTLKQGASMRRDPNWDKPLYIKPDYDAGKGLDDRSRAWLNKRGITDPVIDRNRITSGPAFMPQLDEVVNTIQFPFYRNGEVVNIKYRDGQKNFRMQGNAERILYGLDDINPEVTVIVEGEMDKLSLEVAGIPNCVSVPNGATKGREQNFDYMESCAETLKAIQQFIIAVDADEPGQRLEEELVHRLGKHRCTLVRWPAGIKDANEFLLKHGADALQAHVYGAEPPPVEGTVRVSNIMERLERYYDEGRKPGLDPGWKGLDPLYKIAAGEWTLVTGIPGHGKSEFLDALLINLANLHDWKFAVYSPETSSLEEHVAKLLEKKVGAPFRGHPAFRMSKDDMRVGALWIDQHFYFLDIEGDSNLKLDRILELTRELIFQHGIKGLVIDPWNEIEHERPPHLTETEYISRCLSKIRQFVRKYNIHLWIVAHPTKLQKVTTKDHKEQYPVPTAYDVAGSANWRNKAFNILSVWRDASTDDPVQVHVQKIKFKKNGKVGKCLLVYDTDTGRFSDVLIA